MITNLGMVLNLPLRSLAYLGRARALDWRVLPTLRIRIETFFDCRKGADSNTPSLLRAHDEFDRLNAATERLAQAERLKNGWFAKGLPINLAVQAVAQDTHLK